MTNHSYTWKSIVHGASLLKQGIGRIINNGRSTSFWKDNWSGLGALQDISTRTIPPDIISLSVRDVWYSTNRWNWELLADFLSANSLYHLASVVLFPEVTENDSWYWPDSSNGVYSVSTGYSALQRQRSTIDLSHARVWGAVWKIQIPERIQTLVWLAFHGAFLCNDVRRRRHFITDGNCSYCKEIETPIHVLRDCVEARKVWVELIPTYYRSIFFSMDLKDWIAANLVTPSHISNLNWQVIFSTCIWWLWKWRNNRVFNGSQENRSK
ncbi:hypothetical protein M5689_008991 [Euphorbia peplus]|nr:hypothetical protein M5689_008991 [Euphorbia peplus]